MLVLMMFCIGITTVNRNLKEKLEFTSEFFIFYFFSTFVTVFILVVDFCVMPA